jgi:hypothetical protein
VGDRSLVPSRLEDPDFVAGATYASDTVGRLRRALGGGETPSSTTGNGRAYPPAPLIQSNDSTVTRKVVAPAVTRTSKYDRPNRGTVPTT